MNRNNPSISAAELQRGLDNKEQFNLLDVRLPVEFYSYNIGGFNIGVDKLRQNLHLLPYNKADTIVVICMVGKRSKTAQSILAENGYENVRNLKGGLLALKKLRSK